MATAKTSPPIAGAQNVVHFNDACSVLSSALHAGSPTTPCFLKALVVGANGWGKTRFCDEVIARHVDAMDVLHLKQCPAIDTETKAKTVISNFVRGRSIMSFFSSRTKLVFIDDIEMCMRTERGYGSFLTELLGDGVQAHVLMTCGLKELKRLPATFKKRLGRTYMLSAPTPEECTSYLVAAEGGNDAVRHAQILRLAKLYEGNVRHVLNDLNAVDDTPAPVSADTGAEPEAIEATPSTMQQEHRILHRARHLNSISASTLDLMQHVFEATESCSASDTSFLVTGSDVHILGDAMLPLLMHENYVAELKRHRYKLPEARYRQIVADATEGGWCAEMMEAHMYRHVDWDMYENVSITRCGRILGHLAGVRRRRGRGHRLEMKLQDNGGKQKNRAVASAAASAATTSSFTYTPLLTNLAMRTAYGRKLEAIKTLVVGHDVVDEDAVFAVMDALAARLRPAEDKSPFPLPTELRTAVVQYNNAFHCPA